MWTTCAFSECLVWGQMFLCFFVDRSETTEAGVLQASAVLSNTVAKSVDLSLKINQCHQTTHPSDVSRLVRSSVQINASTTCDTHTAIPHAAHF